MQDAKILPRWNYAEGKKPGCHVVYLVKRFAGVKTLKNNFSKKTLKNGIIWRVGNGRNIDIWSDPWLPREWTRRPITPRDGCLLRKVEELSDPGTEQWDVELVTQTFFVEDARLILALAVHAELDFDLQTKCIENMISE